MFEFEHMCLVTTWYLSLISCYLFFYVCVLLNRCDERIQKIQTIKMMEGIFICAAPHCLRSFLKKPDFESHVHHLHASLLLPDAPLDKEDGNDSDLQTTKHQSSASSDSTLMRGPLRSHQQQQPPPLLHRSPSLSKPLSRFGSYPADNNDNSRPPGFETASPKPGIRFPDYPLPMNMMQPPPTMPIPNNRLPQQFSFPPYPTTDGSSQQFYNGAPFEMTRPEDRTRFCARVSAAAAACANDESEFPRILSSSVLVESWYGTASTC